VKVVRVIVDVEDYCLVMDYEMMVVKNHFVAKDLVVVEDD
ncbi:hypothetical protein A2U01_0107613, partial [Trifolium medium]|nr:hypothetical protein [Trifolium medium]